MQKLISSFGRKLTLRERNIAKTSSGSSTPPEQSGMIARGRVVLPGETANLAGLRNVSPTSQTMDILREFVKTRKYNDGGPHTVDVNYRHAELRGGVFFWEQDSKGWGTKRIASKRGSAIVRLRNLRPPLERSVEKSQGTNFEALIEQAVSRGREYTNVELSKPENLSISAFAKLARLSIEVVVELLDKRHLLEISPLNSKLNSIRLPDWQTSESGRALSKALLTEFPSISAWEWYAIVKQPLYQLDDLSPVQAIEKYDIKEIVDAIGVNTDLRRPEASLSGHGR
jgi:hypothetical protein